jgi:hypothetical protein
MAGMTSAAPPKPRAAQRDTSSIDLWTLLKAWLAGLFSSRRN